MHKPLIKNREMGMINRFSGKKCRPTAEKSTWLRYPLYDGFQQKHINFYVVRIQNLTYNVDLSIFYIEIMCSG